MSLVSDFLTDCFENTATDFGVFSLAYGSTTIDGTLSVVTDEKELMPGGFERNIRATFCTTGERFATLFSDPALAIGKQVTVDGRTYRIERVENDAAICNIGLISPQQAK